MIELLIIELIPEPARVSMAFSITGAAVADTYPKLKKALTSVKAGLFGFQEMDATLAGTAGWQETPYLLADVEAAALLDRSIRSAAHDRTDEFTAFA